MTYYEFLGVSFSATQEEIKNAYRRMPIFDTCNKKSHTRSHKS